MSRYFWPYNVLLNICVMILYCGREFQRPSEVVADKLAAYLKEQTYKKEELISKTAAEAVAKKNKQRREKEKMKAAMLRSISEPREAIS